MESQCEEKNGIGATDADVVRAIAATCQVEIEEVRPEVAIDDLGLGSLGLVAVISRLEALNEMEFTPDEVVSLLQTTRVGEFTAKINELMLPEATLQRASVQYRDRRSEFT